MIHFNLLEERRYSIRNDLLISQNELDYGINNGVFDSNEIEHRLRRQESLQRELNTVTSEIRINNLSLIEHNNFLRRRKGDRLDYEIFRSNQPPITGSCNTRIHLINSIIERIGGNRAMEIIDSPDFLFYKDFRDKQNYGTQIQVLNRKVCLDSHKIFRILRELLSFTNLGMRVYLNRRNIFEYFTIDE